MKTVTVPLKLRFRAAPDHDHVNGGAQLNRDARRAASRVARRGRAPYQIQVVTRRETNLLFANGLLPCFKSYLSGRS